MPKPTRKAARANPGKQAHRTPRMPSKDMILNAFLAEVPFDGWRDDALAAAAKKLNITAEDARLILGGGLLELADAFLAAADQAMEDAIGRERAFARFKVREKIAFGVRERLEALAPRAEALQRCLFFLALPPQAPQAVRLLWRSCDRLWRLAGDEATDFNHYTKRLLLAGVMSTTMLFWLQDDSEGKEASWRFLDNRIADVLRVGGTLGQLKNLSSLAEQGLKFLRRKRH